MRRPALKSCGDCGRLFEAASGAALRCAECRRARARLVFEVRAEVAAEFARLVKKGEGTSAAFARLVREAVGASTMAEAEREAVEKGWIKEETAS